MEICKPDLKAPRAKAKAGYCPINTKLWREFKKQTGSTISYREFSDIIKEGNLFISEIVEKERDGFRLMNSIGSLILVSCAPPKRFNNYDYGKLNKEGVKVKHQNWETERRLCHIMYVTYGVKDMFLNRKLWDFEAVREFKRKSSNTFRSNYTIYKYVHGFENVASTLKKEKLFIKQMEEEQDYLKTYDDLEI